MKKLIIFGFVLLLFSSFVFGIDSITTEDTTILSNNPTYTGGSDTIVYVQSRTISTWESYFEFETGTALKVKSGFNIYINGIYSPVAAIDIEFYYCDDSFDESTLTWNNKGTEITNCNTSSFYNIALDSLSTGWLNIAGPPESLTDSDGTYTIKIVSNPNNYDSTSRGFNIQTKENPSGNDPYVNYTLSETKFILNAKNFINDSFFNDFSAIINNSVINTSNGSIYYDYDEIVNITVIVPNHFNRSYLNYNTSTNLNSEHWQSVVYSYAQELYSNISIFNFNLTIGNQFNISNGNFTTHYLNADFYEYDGKANNFFYNNSGNFTLSPLEVLNHTIDFYNYRINVTAIELLSGDPISNFNVSFLNVANGINESFETSTGQVLFPTINKTHLVIISSPGFATFNQSVFVNETQVDVVFTLFDLNEISFTFLDENTLENVSNINYEIYGDLFSASGNSGNSSVKLDELPNGIYEVRYGVNDTRYSQRAYFISIPLETADEVNVSLYLLDINESFQFIRVVRDQGSLPYDGFLQVQRAYTRDDNATFDYKIMEIAEIDSEGNAVFQAKPNIQPYRFRILDSSLNIVDVKTPGYLVDSTSELTARTDPTSMEGFYDADGIVSILNYNNLTYTYTFDYSDNAQSIDECCLSYTLSNLDSILTNEDCSSEYQDTLLLTLDPNQNGTYLISATCIINSDPYPRGTAQKNFNAVDNTTIFAFLGPILWIIILVVSGTAGGFKNPVFAIVLAVLGTATMSLSFLGLFFLSAILTGAVLIGGLVVLWLVFR